MVRISFIVIALVAILFSVQTLTTEAASSPRTNLTKSSRFHRRSSSSLKSTVLKIHNNGRSTHRVSSLRWNSTVAAYAQAWANECKWANSGGSYGENIAAEFKSWDDVLNAWYNEGKNYVYDPPMGLTLNTGHFTQMVWKGTTDVGCGVSNCENGPYTPIYVCNYYPHGNVVGDNNEYFKKNVLPPK